MSVKRRYREVEEDEKMGEVEVDDDEEEPMQTDVCKCEEWGMAQNGCEIHPRTTLKPTEVFKNLQIDDWAWFRDPYVCNFTSDAYIQGKTVIFHPTFSFGTAAVRGSKKLTARTRAYWEIMVPYCYGTSMMFGIGTAKTKMRYPISFHNILGGNNHNSMGLSHKGMICRESKSLKFTSSLPEQGLGIIGMYFNGPQRTLSYFLNDKPLGTAFYNIDTTEIYYPMISSTAQKSQFTLVHMFSNLNSDCETPQRLYDLSISKILDSCSNPNALSDILPSSIITKISSQLLQRPESHYQSLTLISKGKNVQKKCIRCKASFNECLFHRCPQISHCQQ